MMTPDQTAADVYLPGVRQVAPAYDADVFYSIDTRGDQLSCPKCGHREWHAMASEMAEAKRRHATPVRSPDPLDTPCPYATWGGAMATHAIQQS